MIFITHDLAEAYLLADQIAVIEAGRLLQIGPPETIVYRPASRSVARLTGNSNFWARRCAPTARRTYPCG